MQVATDYDLRSDHVVKGSNDHPNVSTLDVHDSKLLREALKDRCLGKDRMFASDQVEVVKRCLPIRRGMIALIPLDSSSSPSTSRVSQSQ